jgi:hypothetical protein
MTSNKVKLPFPKDWATADMTVYHPTSVPIIQLNDFNQYLASIKDVYNIFLENKNNTNDKTSSIANSPKEKSNIQNTTSIVPEVHNIDSICLLILIL